MSARRSAHASDEVGRWLRRQWAGFVDLDAAVRARAPDAVHAQRTASRRVRAGIRVYGDLIGIGSRHLVAELGWFGDHLGGVRDLEVAREVVESALAGHGADAHTAGLVRDRLATLTDAAEQSLDAALASGRHRALLELAIGHGARPRPADREVAGALGWARGRVAASWADYRDCRGQPGVLQDLLHRVRRRAKVVRYAAEAVTGAWGRPAQDLVEAYREVSDRLGQGQDAWLAAQLLADIEPARSLVEHLMRTRADAASDASDLVGAASALPTPGRGHRR